MTAGLHATLVRFEWRLDEEAPLDDGSASGGFYVNRYQFIGVDPITRIGDWDHTMECANPECAVPRRMAEAMAEELNARERDA